MLAGYAGTLLLTGGNLETLRQADWRGPFLFIGANICGAFGAVYSKRHPVETSPDMNSAIQMVIGGGVLVVVGTALGEWKAFHPTPTGWAAIAYLMVFGSIVGYSCFVYVLRHASPTVTATYYYANTVVAVLLGGVVLGERITLRTIVSVVVVLGAVLWVQRAGSTRQVT
jgi:drug/metabolite transporter (DMT)-like permease